VLTTMAERQGLADAGPSPCRLAEEGVGSAQQVAQRTERVPPPILKASRRRRPGLAGGGACRSPR